MAKKEKFLQSTPTRSSRVLTSDNGFLPRLLRLLHGLDTTAGMTHLDEQLIDAP